MTQTIITHATQELVSSSASNAFVLTTAQKEAFIKAVQDTVTSVHSKRAYKTAINGFLDHLATNRLPFNSLSVRSFLATLSNKSAATRNQKLAAIKKAARLANEMTLIDWSSYQQIKDTEQAKNQGQRVGNWLSLNEVKKLLKVKDKTANRGARQAEVSLVRDRALIALAVGTGLRREELAGLCWEQVVKRGRVLWINNVRGKGNKLRSVPVQRFAVKHLNKWRAISDEGYVLKGVKRNGSLTDKMSSQSIRDLVSKYGKLLDVELAPHDLRRTYAALLDESSTPVREIQTLLGHASMVTTERYLKPIRDSRTLRDDYFTI